MKDIEFLAKLSSLSSEKKDEILRLVNFAFEEGQAVREQYGLEATPPQDRHPA
jgi:hypothetical protein